MKHKYTIIIDSKYYNENFSKKEIKDHEDVIKGFIFEGLDYKGEDVKNGNIKVNVKYDGPFQQN